MPNRNHGFSLIELLIAILIVGLLYSLITPSLKGVYQRYKSALLAEKVLLFINNKQLEAFLYGKEVEFSVKDGTLYTTDGDQFISTEVHVEMIQPLKFQPGGTTSGGTIKVYVEDFCWRIDVIPPTGPIRISMD